MSTQHPQTPAETTDAPATSPVVDADLIPLPGAGGPLGGSPSGEVVDGLNQSVDLPGDKPPLSTDSPGRA
ncbi:MAG: hypothetical protein IT305_27265 [Chloroflexi bacterium]|nr:hypothetical protein [Chloroflexota bacterium]